MAFNNSNISFMLFDEQENLDNTFVELDTESTDSLVRGVEAAFRRSKESDIGVTCIAVLSGKVFLSHGNAISLLRLVIHENGGQIVKAMGPLWFVATPQGHSITIFLIGAIIDLVDKESSKKKTMAVVKSALKKEDAEEDTFSRKFSTLELTPKDAEVAVKEEVNTEAFAPTKNNAPEPAALDSDNCPSMPALIGHGRDSKGVLVDTSSESDGTDDSFRRSFAAKELAQKKTKKTKKKKRKSKKQNRK